jgi:hypothetical protein
VIQATTIPLDEDGDHQKQMVERVANILEAELEYLKDMYKPTVFEDEAKTLQERNAKFLVPGHLTIEFQASTKRLSERAVIW